MKKSFFYFAILSILFIFNTYVIKYLLDIDNLVYNSLAEKLTNNQINEILNIQKKWQWTTYVIIPIFLFIKTILVSSIIYIGAFFYSKVKVTFKQLWYIVVKSEFVFLLVGFAKIIWFCFFQINFTLEDIQNFYPLSALNIVGYRGLDAWFIYPLQTLNLFEFIYWFLLSFYIGKITSPTKSLEQNKYPIDFGLKIVASSYGSALLLWVVVVMFFTLNYS
jgi:hypothetical protein